MKQSKSSKQRTWAKAIGVAIAGFAAGIALLVFSRLALQSARADVATQPAAAMANDNATATSPADADAGAGSVDNDHAPGDGHDHAHDQGTAAGNEHRQPTPAEKKLLAAQRFSGLLLLFSLMGFALGAICVGWVVYDIRRSRPAWMTQTKYPVHDRPKRSRK